MDRLELKAELHKGNLLSLSDLFDGDLSNPSKGLVLLRKVESDSWKKIRKDSSGCWWEKYRTQFCCSKNIKIVDDYISNEIPKNQLRVTSLKQDVSEESIEKFLKNEFSISGIRVDHNKKTVIFEDESQAKKVESKINNEPRVFAEILDISSGKNKYAWLHKRNFELEGIGDLFALFKSNPYKPHLHIYRLCRSVSYKDGDTNKWEQDVVYNTDWNKGLCLGDTEIKVLKSYINNLLDIFHARDLEPKNLLGSFKVSFFKDIHKGFALSEFGCFRNERFSKRKGDTDLNFDSAAHVNKDFTNGGAYYSGKLKLNEPSSLLVADETNQNFCLEVDLLKQYVAKIGLSGASRKSRQNFIGRSVISII